MPISLYNTITRTKEPLTPIEPGHVKLYVCGITAYDYCHIGHARSALVFDMMVRYLRYRGLKVTFVRNFTDIDDKIIKRAAEQETTCTELSERFIRKFHEDMAALNIIQPDLEPKATEHVDEIIRMISLLIERGLAYQEGSDVYYRVNLFEGYGKLSGRQLDEMQAGARITINEAKENPMDFALWKGSKPGEPTWESPWGPGRPGWHIECSAMSRRYLGDTFDIHGGGKDLIFPHHENEIAQSEGATGCCFARHWIHHGFVTIKDEKMSKSLGNFLTIREVLALYPAEALRLLVFSTHYRNPLDYSDASMKDAVTGLERLYNCMDSLSKLPNGTDISESLIDQATQDRLLSLEDRFLEAMDNDLNTAQGLGLIYDTVKDLNRIRQTLGEKSSDIDITILKECGQTLTRLSGIMGLLNENPTTYLHDQKAEKLEDLEITPEEIQQLIEDRKIARSEKNWGQADEIRDLLLARSIELKDGPEGTSWHIKKD
ncbi:MAG: cysteine--tRNA ligase [Proteobacteria bacterium]|nr:cysteine--tRNA ligase [Pseudomonadota bacterium]MBU1688687.1 cysteine--tRNA ligase [Pseudomonadota bacterium]